MHVSLVDWFSVLVGNLAAALLFLWAMQKAALSRAVDPHDGKRALIATSIFLGVWYAADLYFAFRGYFAYNSGLPAPIAGVAVLLPVVVGAIAAVLWAPLRSVIAAIPHENIIRIQVFRVIGYSFLVLMYRGLLPPQFALPAGIGDVFIGIDALIVAQLYARGSRRAPAIGLLWNALGVLDLVIAISIGTLGSTSPIRLFNLTPPTDLMTMLPMVMIPAFAVPFYFILHIVSIRRCLAELKTEKRSAFASAT